VGKHGGVRVATCTQSGRRWSQRMQSRQWAIEALLREAREHGIQIHIGPDVEAYLDWSAQQRGLAPSQVHASTLGDDIFVRAAYADNPRVLREEMIHVAQGRAGHISSDRIVANEIAAREIMIRHAVAWGITADEVAEMQREIAIMRRTERY
jgi:hypothetical protein